MSATPPPEARAVRLIETAGAAAAIAVARRLGESVVAPLLDRAVRQLALRHPRAFEALERLPAATVLIEPQDHDAAIALTVGSPVSVRIVTPDTPRDARIRGPLPALLDLMEGRIDGDALFFRRELKIDGDTELVVAVRNAFDGEDMDLATDLASAFGPLERAVEPVRAGIGRVARLADDLRAALLAPVNARLDGIERRIDRLGRGGV